MITCRIITGIVAFYMTYTASAQEIPSSAEQKLENLTAQEDVETEDDSYMQQLVRFRKHPLNLNTATADEMKELVVVTPLQIENLLIYRRLLGNLLSIYELQAIPTWDINTIKKIQPFVTTTSSIVLPEEARIRFTGGEHSLVFRYSQILERQKGFKNPPVGNSYYLGGPQRYFFRYQYRFKDLLQFGVLGDKDAGEQFFNGAQRYGFDYYSFHLIVRKLGIIQSLVVGDFTVNMGQGLVQWQSLGFRKNADVLGFKRQSALLRPYHSAGEYNFHRGAGITIGKGKINATAFASLRKITANFVTDTVAYDEHVSSFSSSGYHRTPAEVEDRNKLKQLTWGGNILYRGSRWRVNLNTIWFQFSERVEKRPEPHNKYAVYGKNWANYSVDYNYTYRNFHFFGEAAMDQNFNKAFINGMLISVDPRVDVTILHRHIDQDYQAINGNAFLENTNPTNENGLFTGMTIRPGASWRLDAYMDIYSFPWLKYLVDAPSRGKDYLVQLMYTPNKQLEIYTRYRNETKQSNAEDDTSVTNFLVSIPKQNWRTQIAYRVNPSLIVRCRAELLWYDKETEKREQGFLGSADFRYGPPLKPYSMNFRLQYFETGDYNSRIYAYENDVLYYFSIPAFFNKGFRYYLNFSYNLNSKISFWVKWSQTLYSNVETIGSGLDEISGSKKSEIRFMTRLLF
ncbi:MAG TPA: helix-hairpin-helix domain-containing protein [Chitinophagaceae bacterium]|nr:helix-hairpin-helix domain-containing protein [Chitinophagaceae bacterium]